MGLQTTVEEALWVSCRLRLSNHVDDVTALAFVREVSLFCFLTTIDSQKPVSAAQR